MKNLQTVLAYFFCVKTIEELLKNAEPLLLKNRVRQKSKLRLLNLYAVAAPFLRVKYVTRTIGPNTARFSSYNRRGGSKRQFVQKTYENRVRTKQAALAFFKLLRASKSSSPRFCGSFLDRLILSAAPCRATTRKRPWRTPHDQNQNRERRRPFGVPIRPLFYQSHYSRSIVL